MDENYIKHQAKRALKTNSPAAKEDFLWRILSNKDEPNLSINGSLTEDQYKKAETIAKEVLLND